MSDFINMEAEYITQSHICLCNRCMPKLKKFVEENPDYTIYQPQVIQVNDKVIVLYVKGIREKQEIASVKYKYYYQILSADAEILQGETEIECPLNAMEQPIYVNGKVQWVYAYNGKIGLGTIEIK